MRRKLGDLRVWLTKKKSEISLRERLTFVGKSGARADEGQGRGQDDRVEGPVKSRLRQTRQAVTSTPVRVT